MVEPFLPGFPGRLTLELTNACNYRCAMCPSRLEPGRAKGMMEAALFKRIVDQAAERLPVALVPFFRGESLLHPQLVELLAYARGIGLGPIQLVTNGLLLEENLASALLGLGLDFISFSLDTVHLREYERIRPGGDFNQVMANVEGFLRLRDAGGYTTEVQVSATRCAHNTASISDFVSYWRNRADRTRIYYEHSADGHTGSLDCLEVPKDMERQPCHKLYSDMVVYFDGTVASCNHDWFRTEPLGDLRQQSVVEVWLGPSYEKLRGQHRNPEEMTDATCRHCDHWKMYYLDKPFIGELYSADREEPLVHSA